MTTKNDVNLVQEGGKNTVVIGQVIGRVVIRRKKKSKKKKTSATFSTQIGQVIGDVQID